MAANPLEISRGRAAEAGEDLLAAAEGIFGARCKAAWLSGSFAYQGARPCRSDIDVVVVLEGVAMPADAATLSLVREFVGAYLDVHARYGFDPDLAFPGEFVTPQMIDETIAWRGLAHEGALPDPAFPPVESSDYWLGRPDRWYNAWLSETAFSRQPTGDRDYHSAVKLAAWQTILRFLLLRAGRPSLLPDELLLGLGQFGVKPRYPAFWEEERPWLERALDALAARGDLAFDDGWVVPRIEPLRAWERRVQASIDNQGSPPLLLDLEGHREIEAHAEQRWRALAPAS